MTTLWNPKRPLNQPPHFGLVGAKEAPKQTAFDEVAQKVSEALYDSQSTRRKRAGSFKTVFDRSTSGSR